MITGHEADGPAPELREELMLFGQFVGDWEIDDQHLRPDGSTVREKGELHLGWILNGRGVQDFWISHGSQPENSVAAGTTIRFYDPREGGMAMCLDQSLTRNHANIRGAKSG